MNDTERLDWLETIPGVGIINDDNGHWAVSCEGVQNMPDGDEPQDIHTTYFLEKDRWYDSIRDAIDAFRKEYEEDDSA